MKKLLHCDWKSGNKPIIKVYSITAKSYICYILAIFKEKQIWFLFMSDFVYAVHAISNFPLK